MWDRRRETRDMRQEMWDRDVRQETWDRREVAGTFSKKFFLCPFLFFYCPVSFCAHPFLLCSDFLYNFWCYVVISLLPATPSPPPPAWAICHQCHVFVPTPSFLRTDLSHLNLMVILSSPCCPATPFPPCRVICHQGTFFVPTSSSLRSDLQYLMVKSFSPCCSATPPPLLPESFTTSVTFLCPSLPLFVHICHI